MLRLCARFGMIEGRGVKQLAAVGAHILENMISPLLTREGLPEARDKSLDRFGRGDKRVAV